MYGNETDPSPSVEAPPMANVAGAIELAAVLAEAACALAVRLLGPNHSEKLSSGLIATPSNQLPPGEIYKLEAHALAARRRISDALSEINRIGSAF